MSDSKFVQVAEQIRKDPASHEYFFNKLEDPAWLKSLAKMKFFRAPPEPERSGDLVRYPGWPESRYLVRVASRAPEEVLNLVRAIGPTDNPRVHHDLFDIAAELPGPAAAELARKETKWLREYTGHLMGVPHAAISLLTHLADEGQLKAAFGLAGVLLAVTRKDGPGGPREATPIRLDDYEYGEVIQAAWPAMIAADAGRALCFLCDRLGDALHADDIRRGDADLTIFWRPAVEAHEQNLGQGVLDTLIDAVRDQSFAVAQTQDGWQLATSILEARREPIFRRIALNLLRVQGSVEAVAKAVTDDSLAYEINFWHEYGELLRDRFAELTPEQQGKVLTILAHGPEEEEMTAQREEQGETADYLRRRERNTRLKRYALIAEHLSGEYREEYEALSQEFPEPGHLTLLTYTTASWVGPTSPYTEADLTELTPEEVAEKLRAWIPERGVQVATPEGLGRVLEKAVAARPADFAAAADKFVRLEATYVRSLLAGLMTAVGADQAFPWQPVLALSKWVLEQRSTNGDERSAYMDHDPHWGWAQKQVASLLSRGFAAGAAEAPQSERNTIWALLTVLAENPDPAPAQEEHSGSDGMDPATLAINTTRGETMHAVVRYVLWVERSLGEQAPGIAFAPEAKELLERHLDVTTEPSRAIRAVYGQWFPQFVRLDDEWARQLAPRVFSTAPELAELFDAAWNAYVIFNQPFTDVFAVLEAAYTYAVENVGEQDESTHGPDGASEHLAQHLLNYRVRGTTAGGDDDLFARFWLAEQPALRKQFLTRTGWLLGRNPELPDDLRDRFKETWEWIFKHTSESDPGSLAGFGAWLAAPAFDTGWLLEQARAVLDLGIHLAPDSVVYQAIPRLSSEHPREAVAVLRGMVLTDTEGWSLFGSVDEIRGALQAALAAEDADTRREAVGLVHLLGARGMTEFRDLATDAATDSSSQS
jgi:hypothetical protein